LRHHLLKINNTGYVRVIDLAKYPEVDVNKIIIKLPWKFIFWMESQVMG